jgi:tetratricopeptide (TPR) repeat protein
MMTGQHPPPPGVRTSADALRERLEQCEDRAAQIDKGTNGLELLVRLDDAMDQLEHLEARGVDLRAERGRLQHIFGQIRRHEKTLVSQIGPALAANRPTSARWWWYLDEQVAVTRQRRIKQGLGAALLLALFLVGLYHLYDNVLAPPWHIREANARFSDGEWAVAEGDWRKALEHFKDAATLNPDRAETYIWLGALYEKMGQTAQSQIAFQRAQTAWGAGIGIDFWLHRGWIYLSLGEEKAAYQDAWSITQAAPDQPEGHFLLGAAAEQAGDFGSALAAFERTSATAEATGNAELQALARLRIAKVLQRLMAMPQE